MPLFYVIPLSALVFLFVQFLAIGAVDKRIKNTNVSGKFALAGTLALLKTIRQFAILAFLVYSTVWICVAIGSFSWARDIASFGRSIAYLDGLRKGIDGFFSIWKRVLASGLIVLVGYTYYIRRRRKLRAEMQDTLETEARRLMPDIQAESNGNKPPRTPSAKMQECAAQIRRVDEMIATTVQEAARLKLYQIRAQLQQQLLVLDVERRIDREFEAVPSLKRTMGWGGLLNQGLLDDLKGLPKLGGIVCNALLLLSLLSINSPGIMNEIRARSATLSEAQIRATIHEQKQELQEIGIDPDQQPANNTSSPQPISPEDERTIQRAAAYYEHAFSSSRDFRPRERTASGAASQSKENLVREAILSDFNAAESASHTSGAPAEPVTPDEPVTRTGHRFAEDLRASFKAAPEHLRERFRKKFASYHEPIHAMSAEEFLVGEVFGYGVDKVPLDASGFVADQAKEFVKDFGGDEIKETYARIRNEMFAGAYGNDNAEEALNRVNDPRRVFVRADKEAALKETIATAAARSNSEDVFGNHQPSAKAPVEENADVVQLVKDVNVARGDKAMPLTDPLLAYNDIAPEAAGAELDTARGVLTSALEGAANGFARGAEESAFRFTMGRSFSMLAGSFRVGGVLIGIDPPGARNLDFRGIDWTVERGQVQISLVRANGSAIGIGSFPKATVAQALNYAADGRPLAATMVSAPPLYDLKILAHPTLVDTVLGARIIEMDRYVDRFTGGDEQRRRAEKLIYAQNALYELAWYARQSALGIGDAELRDTRSEMAAEDAQLALSSPDTFKDKQTSLLLAKTDFYDRELVATMARCPKTSVDGFAACIRQAFKGSSVTERWRLEPPSFQIWSGVRELPYTTDSNLDFLLKRNDELWPFTFLVQVAFTSEPLFAQKSAAGYADTTPFELPFLTERVRAAVARGVNANPEDRASFEAVKEFATLQRLFRVALKGGLGSQFPIEKLVTLKQGTRTPQVACKTPRWNPHPGGVEAKFLRTIQYLGADLPTDDSILSHTKSQISACLLFASRRSDVDRIAPNEWDRACGFEQISNDAAISCFGNDEISSPACAAAKAIGRLALITSKTRQIRFAEGLPALEVQRHGMCVGD